MTDRPFNVYQDVADEARADWLANRPEPEHRRRRQPRPWDGNPETAPDTEDPDDA